MYLMLKILMMLKNMFLCQIQMLLVKNKKNFSKSQVLPSFFFLISQIPCFSGFLSLKSQVPGFVITLS